MKSTAVNDVASLFWSQAASGAGKAASGGGAFQKVWNSQTGKGASGNSPESVRTRDGAGDRRPVDTAEEQPLEQKGRIQKDPAVEEPTEGAPVEKTDAEDPAAESPDGEEAATEEPGEVELTDAEEQLRAMEVLGTAAWDLMNRVADLFGVTLEAVRESMDRLGMVQTDLLDASKLGSLLLEVAGAADSYALLTDPVLYDNYQTVMSEMDSAVRESAAELGLHPERLRGILDDIRAEAVPEPMRLAELESPQEPESPEPLESTEALRSEMVPEAVPEEAARKQDTDTQERGGRQAEGRADRDGQMNHFAQVRIEPFQPGLRQVENMPQNTPWSEDTRQIMDQILDYMKLNLKADATSLEMQLHPESLGTLQVQIASKGGIVTANFITQNDAVKVALESQMLQLREQFEAQGVKVEAIEVTVQAHAFEQNLEQGRGRGQQDPEKRGRGRRIQLEGAFAVDHPEAEESVAADRVAVDGSTVSYTA